MRSSAFAGLRCDKAEWGCGLRVPGCGIGEKGAGKDGWVAHTGLTDVFGPFSRASARLTRCNPGCHIMGLQPAGTRLLTSSPTIGAGAEVACGGKCATVEAAGRPFPARGGGCPDICLSSIAFPAKEEDPAGSLRFCGGDPSSPGYDATSSALPTGEPVQIEAKHGELHPVAPSCTWLQSKINGVCAEGGFPARPPLLPGPLLRLRPEERGV
jgi:hypothetical protein